MKRTAGAAALTDLILEVFVLNGQLLSAGDQLTKPLGLTSARWQVLGAIDLAGRSMSVSQIGRRMGLSRQTVQRIANDMEALGFVTYERNLDHVRAKLVVPTLKGRKALEHIKAVQTEWSNRLAKGLSASKINEAVELLRDVGSRIEIDET